MKKKNDQETTPAQKTFATKRSRPYENTGNALTHQPADNHATAWPNDSHK